MRIIDVLIFFFLMIRRPPRSTQGVSSAASDVYKRQDINMNDYKKAVREMYQILYEKKVPLAAWWVYTDRKTSFHIGVINQDHYTNYEWIVDIINEYNEKLARDLKQTNLN
eukprot:TRINITY_DN28881_c0_g1_i1.p2 TRINITY_DN28881_c0_g1~~TRINITY_DN28881_c0_g1_i1.p2  ORF type:complete len:111 (+),score=28.45 TRINITY_DN28881_c0_g1_i1:69-401(+)